MKRKPPTKTLRKCLYCGDEFLSLRRKHCDKPSCKYSHNTRNPRSRFEAHLRSKYEITLEQYDSMLLAQGGVCKICQRKQSGARRNERMSVDHDHATGQIRGILCHQCNAGLGWFRDDARLLRAAAEYLDQSRESSESSAG